MNDITRSLTIVLVVAICTFATRAFPFVVFGKSKEIPQVVKQLGKILPMAVIGILVIYCLKGVSFTSIAGFLPSVIAVVFVVVIHVWKRNNLMSIGIGTVVYMLLLQLAV